MKSWPEYFQPLVEGIKGFELRRDDRGFQVGDRLIVREYVIDNDTYTGRDVALDVTYIAQGLPWLCPGHVCMSVRPAR